MVVMTPDPYALLEEIRRELSTSGATYAHESALLAAVEAALKLADEWDRPVPEYDDRMNVRQDCSVRLYEAIQRGLAGTEVECPDPGPCTHGPSPHSWHPSCGPDRDGAW